MRIIITKATFVRGTPLLPSLKPIEMNDTVARVLIEAHKAVKAPADIREPEPEKVEDAPAGAGESEPKKVEDAQAGAGPKKTFAQRITGR